MARILVIDDDDQFRELICSQLKRAGHSVMDAADGYLGLEMQRSANADLIITDIFMPGMEGTELIMDLTYEFPDTHIIAISGGGNVNGVDYLTLAENLGAYRTFKKPFKKQNLLDAVASLLP